MTTIGTAPINYRVIESIDPRFTQVREKQILSNTLSMRGYRIKHGTEPLITSGISFGFDDYTSDITEREVP